MDDDDEEIAELRRMRAVAARRDASGPSAGGGGLQELVERQKRAQAIAIARSSAFYDDDDGPSAKKPRAAAEDDEDAALRAMLPGGFGSATPGAKRAAIERERVLATQRRVDGRPSEGPSSRPPPGWRPPPLDRDAPVTMRPPPARTTERAEEEEEEVEEEEDDDDDDARVGAAAEEEYDDFLPLKNEAVMDGHRKVVSALALEHTGSRLLTGSHDYTVKMYDFNGMRRDLRPFREITPDDGYPIHALSWSPSGDQFLVVTGGPQPKIYDRDGRELGEFDKGDMYIRDLKNTKGHCSPCTSGAWHPTDRDQALTASADGSLRIWNVSMCGDPRGAQKSVVKPQLARPGRVQVTSCAYNHDGSMIAGGVTDGTVQLFPSSGGSSYRNARVGLVLPPSAQCHLDNHWSFASRPKTTFKSAHAPGESITSVAFARDGNMVLSRCADGTLKVWDARNASKVVKVFHGLETTHEETQVGFSPNDAFFYTGVDAPMSRASEGDGALCVFSKDKLEMVRKIGTKGNCVAAAWHARLNQLFLGCGDHKGGHASALYDDRRSERGMLVCVGRKARSKSNADFVNISLQNIAYTPHALPMFKEPMPGKKAEGEGYIGTRKSKEKSKKPLQVQSRKAAGTLLTQSIMKESGMIGDKNWRLQDPREAILRHAKDAEENPWRTRNAYAETQPEPIFHESEDEASDSD